MNSIPTGDSPDLDDAAEAAPVRRKGDRRTSMQAVAQERRKNDRRDIPGVSALIRTLFRRPDSGS